MVTIVQAQAPSLRLTIDPLEFRGLRYHTGVAMTVFAPGRHEELARGGRYLCGEREPATGLTLYADAVLRAAPGRPTRRVILMPLPADLQASRALRAEGFVTLASVDPHAEPHAEALRLGCTHVWSNGAAHPLNLISPPT